jgi:hypothetical protein
LTTAHHSSRSKSVSSNQTGVCISNLSYVLHDQLISQCLTRNSNNIWYTVRSMKLLRLLCGAGGYPPNVLQPFETYCTNPALVSPFHLQRRSTSTGVRDLYQRKVELWARNVRSNLVIQTRLPR